MNHLECDQLFCADICLEALYNTAYSIDLKIFLQWTELSSSAALSFYPTQVDLSLFSLICSEVSCQPRNDLTIRKRDPIRPVTTTIIQKSLDSLLVDAMWTRPCIVDEERNDVIRSSNISLYVGDDYRLEQIGIRRSLSTFRSYNYQWKLNGSIWN